VGERDGRRLVIARPVLCISLQSLKSRGVPTRPSDLACGYRSTGDRGPVDGLDGPVTVTIKPWMQTNNRETCRAVALAHHGVILQPTFLVGQDLAAGRRVESLPGFRSIELGIYAIYPTRKHVALEVRALIDCLAEHSSASRSFRRREVSMPPHVISVPAGWASFCR
jgi:DNA-binding transcriptional LysR family regulator